MAALSARDRNSSRYQLYDGLNAWSTNRVLNRNALYCAGCSAGQPVHFADEAFGHVAGRRQADDVNAYPWRELSELLRTLPAAEP